MRERIIYINVIHIKCMFRQFKLTELQEIRSIDHRMHQYVLSQMKTLNIIPSENLILRKHILVFNDFLMNHSFLFIYIIGNQHIYLLLIRFKILKYFQNFLKCLFIYPVIAVHDFKIFSAGIRKTEIHCVTVSAVFFIDCLDDSRILLFISMRNLRSCILRSIIYNNNLYIFPTLQD